MTDYRTRMIAWLQNDPESQQPQRQHDAKDTAPRHRDPRATPKEVRTFAAVAVSNSGMTFASASTGMKFVSPAQRGTTCI